MMSKKSSYPLRFYMMPAFFSDWRSLYVVNQQIRRNFGNTNPDRNHHIDQISLCANEACNLRCKSCGQWGENGHVLRRMNDGGQLHQLSFDVCKDIIRTTRHDHPVYYIWGGEPSMWKPLVPLFEELARYHLNGALVTNAHDIDRLLEPIIETGSLKMLFLSLDGWDSASQNSARSSPVHSGTSLKENDNFAKVMAVIEKADAIKRKKKIRFPWVVPITVITNANYNRLRDIRNLVKDKTQLHQIFYGWFITPERVFQHENVFMKHFGYMPSRHRGYVKSCFDEVDAACISESVRQITNSGRNENSVPQFIPEIYDEKDIGRYYGDHVWDCGYAQCESIYHNIEITPEGNVTPCRDYQDYICGNVYEDNIYDIWNGDKFRNFRRKLKSGLMPVCTRCCGLQGF
jgi:radical SAM protein with 4Fe4S-binding SPASM domain